MNSNLQTALALAKRGWPVFPLHNPTRRGCCSCGKPTCGSPGKHPRTRNGFKAATTDPNRIRDWWKQWPHANIGLATGERSGLVVLDIDGTRGLESLRHLEKEFGHLPKGPVVRTGKGFHFYFQNGGAQ